MSLATDRIENGASRAFVISLGGHIILIAMLFFLPATRKKVFVENIPRSVRLVATLDAPAPPAPPAPSPKVKKAPARPAPKPRPRVVKPAPPPPPAKSRVRIPTRKAPPLVKPREPAPAPTSLKERLQSKLTAVETPPASVPEPSVPKLSTPRVTPLTVPIVTPPAPTTSRETRASLSSFRYRGYVGKVKSSIYTRWAPPSRFALGGKKLSAVAVIRISREGRIMKIDMKRSSGHRIYDQSVMAALTDSAALPPFPKDYKESYLDVEITFRPEGR